MHILFVSTTKSCVSSVLFSVPEVFPWALWPASNGTVYPLCLIACMLSCFSRVGLFMTLWTVTLQAPLSTGFSREEYRSGLPCPPPGYLPDPGIEPSALTSPELVGGFFTTSTAWEALSLIAQRSLWHLLSPPSWDSSLLPVLLPVSYEFLSLFQFYFGRSSLSRRSLRKDAWGVRILKLCLVWKCLYFYSFLLILHLDIDSLLMFHQKSESSSLLTFSAPSFQSYCWGKPEAVSISVSFQVLFLSLSGTLLNLPIVLSVLKYHSDVQW